MNPLLSILILICIFVFFLVIGTFRVKKESKVITQYIRMLLLTFILVILGFKYFSIKGLILGLVIAIPLHLNQKHFLIKNIDGNYFNSRNFNSIKNLSFWLFLIIFFGQLLSHKIPYILFLYNQYKPMFALVIAMIINNILILVLLKKLENKLGSPIVYKDGNI